MTRAKRTRWMRVRRSMCLHNQDACLLGSGPVIPTCDGMFILDNELNERLIKPLPARSQLTAILDCCHSGSLLGKWPTRLPVVFFVINLVSSDLQHFRCNGVYVPWVNKGVRRTDTIQNIRSTLHLWNSDLYRDWCSLNDNSTARKYGRECFITYSNYLQAF